MTKKLQKQTLQKQKIQQKLNKKSVTFTLAQQERQE